MCLEVWETTNKDPTFISRIITGDGSWIYGYDPETKQQSSQWKNSQSPRAKKGVAGLEFNTEHAHCFFNVNLFLLTLRSILSLLWHFEMLERKCAMKKTGTSTHPQLAPSSRQCACSHVPEVTEFVTNNNVVIVPHPPYSLDLAPVISLCFPNQTWNWRDDIWNSGWHPKGITSGTRQH
jgi:hypothetical protein